MSLPACFGKPYSHEVRPEDCLKCPWRELCQLTFNSAKVLWGLDPANIIRLEPEKSQSRQKPGKPR